ncbi:MAG: HD domain-containing phosphohydrolase [bacterium]
MDFNDLDLPAEAPGKSKGAEPRELKVLLLEGESKGKSSTLKLLTKIRGYQPQVVRLSDEKIALGTMIRNEYDVYFLRSNFGMGGGLHFLEEVRLSGCEGPVIVLTDPGESGDVLKMIKAGATDCLRLDELNGAVLERTVRYALDRHYILDALRASEERNRALIHAIPDAMYLVSNDGRFLDYKPHKNAWAPLTPPHELLGKKVDEVTSPGLAWLTLERVEQTLRTGKVQAYEYQLPIEGMLRAFEARVIAVGENKTLALVRDITDRKQAEAKIHRHMQRLEALHTIDSAINGSLDLSLTLGVVLDQITSKLEVDAADILLLNPIMQTLDCAASRGFRSANPERIHLPMGSGYAGRVISQQRLLHIPNLASQDGDVVRAPLLADEEFAAYFGLPLIAKGRVKGVLEIFHRQVLDPDEEWMNFLDSLARQAAIAVDNMMLFEELQMSNLQLRLAYDTTLEGWSRALELRDIETHGHAQRVTDMALDLAGSLGVSEPELPYLRHGALLHDIGKMGIPDNILLKPGPLSDEEWTIMRRHPLYAQQLLLPIEQLRPALDIPLHHHERWDGNGYPQGLKGEQIPLPARIFSVVDVWDALRSDRPYRKAWTEKETRDYLVAERGKYFDPQIVNLFLEEVAVSGVNN